MMLPIVHSSGRAIATATMLGMILLSGPRVMAAEVRQAATQKRGAAEEVETRIRTLREQLRITPEQEPAWNDVARIMRENAKTMKDLRSKVENEKSANAIEQLNSYAGVIDTHSDGVHKFIPAFQTLYDRMSEAQKKTADAVLRARVREAARRQGR